MKFEIINARYNDKKSHPTRGAWIEILHLQQTVRNDAGSHPTRGAWIEILDMAFTLTILL